MCGKILVGLSWPAWGGGISGSSCLEVELGAGRLMLKAFLNLPNACRLKGNFA